MGKIKLISKGIRPDIDNAPIINAVTAGAKDKDIIVMPDGNFPIDGAIQQTNKGLRWEGKGSTEIMIGLPVNAMILKTNVSQSETFITGIDFVNHYGGADNNDNQHGIISSVILNIAYCKVKNFWGHGIVVSADISHNGIGSNASFSDFRKVLISGNRRNGMYFQGGDANKCNVYVDVRDNGGWGIEDASFLGNYFYGCMAHNNAAGNYTATDVNNRATFSGCYSEGGSPVSKMYGQAMIFGGLWSGGVELHDNAVAFWNGKGPNS